MKEYYSFKIPEPCSEDWNQMTPSAKGRFCSSCEKTVIDFTEMSSFEISKYLNENMRDGVCGRIYKSQLDRLVVQIPAKMLLEPRLAHRFFALALLIVMGTTLFSCVSESGNKQKIDAVEVIELQDADSLMLGVVPPPKAVIDSTKLKSDKHINSDSRDEVIPIIGGFGAAPPMPPPVGIIVKEDMNEENVPFAIVQIPPEFPNTPKELTTEEARKYFSNNINKYINDNFNKKVLDSTISGRHKISTQFKIDTNGKIADIKVKANYKPLEAKVLRVLESIPQLVPGKDATNNKVAVTYVLPIIFENE